MRESALYAAVVAMCIALSTPVAFPLDISQYEIVKRKAPNGNGQRWVLHFLKTTIQIPLVPVRERTGEAPDDAQSLIGPDGFNVRWLIDERIVWVSWRTPPQGNGVYYDEAHILTDVSGSDATEIRRVDYPANGNQGAGNRQHLDVEYTYDGRVVTETLKRHDTSMLDHPYPMAVKLEGVGPYFLEEHLSQVTTFTIVDGRLNEGRGKQSLTLGDDAKPIDEVARYIILLTSPRYRQYEGRTTVPEEITQSEVNRALEDLRKCGGFNSQERTISGDVPVLYTPGIVGRPRSTSEEEYIFE
jgi:hypothetical protein